MDPISLIVMALAAGAAAGLKPTAEAAVRDAYAGVKALIMRRYSHVELTPLERKPESEAKRASLAEDLKAAGAGEDKELFELTGRLIDVLRSYHVDAAAVGVDLERVNAEFLAVRSVESEGTGVRVKDSEFRGGIDIGEVRAGRGGANRPDPS